MHSKYITGNIAKSTIITILIRLYKASGTQFAVQAVAT